jgi:eukaryotic-like serine/threonine-protein kinase
MTDSAEPLRAALADRYPIERELGRGGMATVYLARDLRHGRRVAVKVLHPSLAAGLGTERFLREVRIAAGLQHPHILPVHDSGEAAGQLYYVMPFVEGETLRARLDRSGPLPVNESVRLAREVLDALGHAHRHEVVHRDIKPENILLSDGHALVADFGIAKALLAAGDERLTETGWGMGTPPYMSPEQIGGGTVDGRSDLYGLGCMLQEMLTGEPPFTGRTAQELFAQHVRDPPPPVRTRRPEVPAAVERAIRRSLAKAPERRFATAAEFATALAQGPAPLSPWKPKQRRWTLVAAVLGIAAILTIAIRIIRPPSVSLDSNLLAIVPFDARDAAGQRFGEDLVDYLARSLDGAGPIRTVSPSRYLRSWRGPSDPALVQTLAVRMGAGLIVFGTASRAGRDSELLRGSIFDAVTGRVAEEFEVRGDTLRFDALADSAAVGFLRALGRNRAVGAVRQQPFGHASVSALKAFLRGQQFYRRSQWDSALVKYDLAITLDSGFALPYYYLAQALSWGPTNSGRFREPEYYQLRAASLNHGLSERDSTLILTDSLWLSASDTGLLLVRRRLLTVLEQASRSYPGDPEVWYALGEARLHLGQGAYNSTADPLAAFDRAIVLDSGFTPAYEHTLQIAMLLGQPERALQYARASLAHQATAAVAGPVHLSALLLDPATAGSEVTRAAEDSAAAVTLLRTCLEDLFTWPDSAETAVRLARRLGEGRASLEGAPPMLHDPPTQHELLASALAFRGHFREAARASPGPGGAGFNWFEPGALSFDALALFGAAPEQVAARWYARLLDPKALTRPLAADLPQAPDALAWWNTKADTASLRRIEWLTRPERGAGSLEQVHRARVAAEAAAYLALIRGDSAAALRTLLSIPDSACFTSCGFMRITQATLLGRAGRDREALAALDRWLPSAAPSPLFVIGTLERGRIAERVGNRAIAIQAYQYVVDVWRHADPELNGYVGEARASLKRLSARPGAP